MFERLIEPARSRRRIVLVQINFRLEGIRHIHIRPAFHDGIEVGVCLLVLLHEIAAIGSIEPVASFVGTEDQRVLIVVEGVGKLLQSDAALGAGSINLVHIGIEFYRLIEVFFRSSIIVELQFAETPIIPRFIEVRLAGNDVVEMLYRNYEVVVAIGNATRDNQSVGIVLC